MTIDNANNLNPECYVKRESSVKTWNLCSEIFLHTNEHSLTLPEELKQELWKTFCEESIINVRKAWENSVVKTYRAGADQELEAFCEWLRTNIGTSFSSSVESELRAARRPKPPSLKEQALTQLDSLHDDLKAHGLDTNTDTIRCALEQLDD